MIRTLGRREFFKLFAGRLVSNIGDSLYVLALLWLVHEITASGLTTGITGVVLLLPQTLQILIGPLVDGYRVRTLLTAVHLVQGITVLALGVVLLSATPPIELLLGIVGLLAVSAQLVEPAQTKAIKQALPEDELPSGNSLMSIAYEGVDIVFNIAGGIVIAIFGATIVFFIDALTFAVAAALFATLSIGNAEIENSDFSVSEYVGNITSALSHIRDTFVRDLVATSFLINLSMGIAMITLPFFADAMRGSVTYGLLVSSMVAGMLVGSLLSERLLAVGAEVAIIAGFGVTAVSWVLAAVVAHPLLSPALFFVAWIPIGFYNVTEETLIQRSTATERLGQVRAAANSVSSLSLPLGALFGGAVVDGLGSDTTMALVGAGFGLVTVYYLLNPRLRSLPAVVDRAGGEESTA